MTTTVTLDMETIKLIARTSAETVVKEVSAELRRDMRDDFAAMEKRLGDKLDGYFGKLDPATHVIQHDRLNRMILMFDRMGENLFTTIVKKVAWGAIVIAVVGYVGYTKMTGGHL